MALNIDPQFIAGIDDATKCPCIGSIFVAGVTAEKNVISQWKKLGVKDSKLITPKKRVKLSHIIKKTSESFVVREITPEKIDDKSLNLNDWEMVTVLEIITFLQKNIKSQRIYIDNWEVNAQRFFERMDKFSPCFKEDHEDLIIIPEHQADEKYTVVGAASILAKTASDQQYQNYKKKYGDFGSGSPSDPKTRSFVWKHRKNPPRIIRTSWHTYRYLSTLDKIEDDIVSKLKKK